MNKPPFTPQVLRDANGRPYIVFGKGRILWHAIKVDSNIALAKLDTIRGMPEILYKGAPYPVRKAASFYLNHDHREITPRAKAILKALVRRQAKAEALSS